MKRMINLSLVFLVFLFFQSGCSSFMKINSYWKNRDITIDGKNNDWIGHMYYLEEENISVGMNNDDDFVYVCVIAEDIFLRTQMMHQGFILWFDPTGGQEKLFGIKFPLGFQGMRQGNSLSGMRGEWREQGNFPEIPEKLLAELEILGPGEEKVKRMPVEKAKGIEVIFKASSGLMIYELKIPLLQNEDHPYAVEAEPGGLIGIGLEVPEMDREAIREAMKDRMGSSRKGAGGGRMPGGGMPGGMRPRIRNGLNVWLSLQLASNK